MFTNCLSGIREKDIIASTGRWDAGTVKGAPVAAQAYEAGLKS